MSASRITTLSNSLPKETEEKANIMLKYFLPRIGGGVAGEDAEFIEELCGLPYKTLAFLSKNPEIETFCKRNRLAQDYFVKKLKESKRPSLTIKSMDGKEEINVFELYMAASSMSEFKATHATQNRIGALDMSCEIGLNDALLSRCLIYEKTIKKPSVSESQIENALVNFTNDINRLANLYWAFGYIQAGCLLNLFGNHFISINDDARGQTFIEQSVKNFLCAYLLRDHSYSNEIITNVTNGSGLLSLLKEQSISFESWEKALSEFRDWVGDSFVVLEAQAKKEIANSLEKKPELKR